MTREHVSVVIPALNEEQAIGAVVRTLPWDLVGECLVVDNGSSDQTAREAADAGATVITSARGYGNACMAGAAALGSGCEVVVFMDGDGADAAEEMASLLDPIFAGTADFVIGSRLRGTREAGSMLASQVFAGKLVGFLLRWVVGVRYTDMGAFRAIRRTSLQTLDMRELTYGWNLEMQIKAAQRGLRILEVPVSYRRRIAGVSKVSGDFSASLRAAFRIFEVLFRVGFRRDVSKAGTEPG